MWNHISYLTEVNTYCVHPISLATKSYLTEQVKDYLFFWFLLLCVVFTDHFIFYKVCSKELLCSPN